MNYFLPVKQININDKKYTPKRFILNNPQNMWGVGVNFALPSGNSSGDPHFYSSF